MEQIFIDNPKLDVAYKTADGKFFFLETDARNHASTLEDRSVDKVTPQKGSLQEAVTEALANNINVISKMSFDLKDDNSEKKEEVKTDSTNDKEDTNDDLKGDNPEEKSEDDNTSDDDQESEDAEEPKEEPSIEPEVDTKKKSKNKKKTKK